MKRIINLSLIVVFTLSALGVQARTWSADEIKVEISKQIVESNAKYTDAELVATIIAASLCGLFIFRSNESLRFVVELEAVWSITWL